MHFYFCIIYFFVYVCTYKFYFAPFNWYGRPLSELEAATESRVAFLTRLGEGLTPDAQTVLQDGDLVHMMIENAKMKTAESALSQGPGK